MDDLYGPLRARVAEGWTGAMVGPPPNTGAAGSYPDVTIALAFGDVWNRPHLTVRERRIAVLTALTLYGRDDITRFHLQSALQRGDLSHADIEELAVTIAVYAGAPAATTLYMLARQEQSNSGTQAGHTPPSST
jgi:alkylhydroperoxidase/carboxymuconolactone decarboxylase family protein YurZ